MSTFYVVFEVTHAVYISAKMTLRHKLITTWRIYETYPSYDIEASAVDKYYPAEPNTEMETGDNTEIPNDHSKTDRQ